MQRNIQENCAEMERWKKMMDSMINFITVSTELVEKLSNKLDEKYISAKKETKEPEVLFMKNPPEPKKVCAANKARDKKLNEEMIKEQLENVLSKVGIEENKGNCCCTHNESEEIEKMKLKLKSTEKDLKVLHSELNRLGSKTFTISAPGPNATPNTAILYRQIMKDVSQFEVPHQSTNRNAQTQLNAMPFMPDLRREFTTKGAPSRVTRQNPPSYPTKRIPAYFNSTHYSTPNRPPPNYSHPPQTRHPAVPPGDFRNYSDCEVLYCMPENYDSSYIPRNQFVRHQRQQPNLNNAMIMSKADERKYLRTEENEKNKILNTAMIMSDEEYDDNENVFSTSCVRSCGVEKNR